MHDSQALPDLLHGQEMRVWGDAAYSGQHDVIRQHAPGAQRFIQTKAHRHQPLSDAEQVKNRTKSKVRANVKHVFLMLKRIFGFAKVRYRGLAKNTNWFVVTCGLTNLSLARRRLLAEKKGGMAEVGRRTAGPPTQTFPDQRLPIRVPVVPTRGTEFLVET